MICPYNRKQEVQILEWENPDADEGKLGIQKTITSFVLMECPQEGCAVWVDGRCRYAAVSLDNP